MWHVHNCLDIYGTLYILISVDIVLLILSGIETAFEVIKYHVIVESLRKSTTF